MLKFEVGKTYSCTSVCDSNCHWNFTVVNRTDKSILIKGSPLKSISRFMVKPSYDNSEEIIFPLGHYSMAPILRATL